LITYCHSITFLDIYISGHLIEHYVNYDLKINIPGVPGFPDVPLSGDGEFPAVTLSGDAPDKVPKVIDGCKYPEPPPPFPPEERLPHPPLPPPPPPQ